MWPQIWDWNMLSWNYQLLGGRRGEAASMA